MRNCLLILCLFLCQASLPFFVSALSLAPSTTNRAGCRVTRPLSVVSESSSAGTSVNQNDDGELVAKRLVVTGDVQGGYVRACIVNEAGRFRRLVGTMTDPDSSSDRAEIYVEGKRKLVDGFVRWCQRGKVGLSQTLRVVEVIDEEPVGLYENFYCKTK